MPRSRSLDAGAPARCCRGRAFASTWITVCRVVDVDPGSVLGSADLAARELDVVSPSGEVDVHRVRDRGAFDDEALYTGVRRPGLDQEWIARVVGGGPEHDPLAGIAPDRDRSSLRVPARARERFSRYVPARTNAVCPGSSASSARCTVRHGLRRGARRAIRAVRSDETHRAPRRQATAAARHCAEPATTTSPARRPARQGSADRPTRETAPLRARR